MTGTQLFIGFFYLKENGACGEFKVRRNNIQFSMVNVQLIKHLKFGRAYLKL
jgi:hypothetical protein